MRKLKLTPRAYDRLFNDKDKDPAAVLQPRNTASPKPSINNPFNQLQLIKP
jgi:hypothetical protein